MSHKIKHVLLCSYVKKWREGRWSVGVVRWRFTKTTSRRKSQAVEMSNSSPIVASGLSAQGRPLTAATPNHRRPPSVPYRSRSSGVAHAIVGPEGLRLGRVLHAPVQPVCT